MAVGGLPLVAMLKTRMQWHQTRQKVLSENVANADTPGFKPRDVRAPDFTRPVAAPGGLAVDRTNAAHLTLASALPAGEIRNAARFEVTPSGNAVNLEDEMVKVAQNQSDYQLAASLYQKSLQIMRTAIGKGR